MNRPFDREARLSANVDAVRQRIDAAARRAGRQPEDVRLIGVTKYVDSSVATALVRAGCHDLGESRPQELWKKAEDLAALAPRWHFIGHLQRNKVRRTLPLVSLLHAGDSLRLLEEIHAWAEEQGRTVPVLLEVNISGDASKHGFSPAELEKSLDAVARLGGVAVRGLMAMSGLESDAEQTRREFSAVRLLRDRLRNVSPPELGWDELSMGMSGDFEAAIEEGATFVRVGSALFEGLEP